MGRTPSPAATLWRHLAAWDGPSMGGRLTIDLTIDRAAAMNQPHVAEPRDAAPAASDIDATARDAGRRVARRVDAWAARLTRFDAGSALSRLNANPDTTVPVGPTLGAVLAWADRASHGTNGIVDATLLRERLAAEHEGGAPIALEAPKRHATARWRIHPTARGAVVDRQQGVLFDLDGVAKGWLADRALALLGRWPGAIVDADGDIAVRLAPDDVVDIGIADPRSAGRLVGVVRLRDLSGESIFGIATSGVSVHRWDPAGRPSHHLIDPRLGTPAATDLLQATVLAGTAREAEAAAKTAVILGRDAGLRWLTRGRVRAAILLTTDGECIATPESLPWLAAA